MVSPISAPHQLACARMRGPVCASGRAPARLPFMEGSQRSLLEEVHNRFPRLGRALLRRERVLRRRAFSLHHKANSEHPPPIWYRVPSRALAGKRHASGGVLLTSSDRVTSSVTWMFFKSLRIFRRAAESATLSIWALLLAAARFPRTFGDCDTARFACAAVAFVPPNRPRPPAFREVTPALAAAAASHAGITP